MFSPYFTEQVRWCRSAPKGRLLESRFCSICLVHALNSSAKSSHYAITLQPNLISENGITKADIPLEGVFLNADSAFDAEDLKKAGREKEMEANRAINPTNNKGSSTEYRYFDEELYKRRFVVERMNAWLDHLKPCS